MSTHLEDLVRATLAARAPRAVPPTDWTELRSRARRRTVAGRATATAVGAAAVGAVSVGVPWPGPPDETTPAGDDHTASSASVASRDPASTEQSTPSPTGDVPEECRSVPASDVASCVAFLAEAASIAIDADPFIAALAQRGIAATDETGASGNTAPDGTQARNVRLRLADEEGHTGTANIVVASSPADAAALLDRAAWAQCAAAPTEDLVFGWQLLDDPSTSCAEGDVTQTAPLLVVHVAPLANALGASILRSDGSVISVSLSQASWGSPYIPGEPLDELPLTSGELSELLELLSTANPVG